MASGHCCAAKDHQFQRLLAGFLLSTFSIDLFNGNIEQSGELTDRIDLCLFACRALPMWVLRVAVVFVCLTGAAAAPKAPTITLIGEATIRLTVDHHASQYTDDGAICVDPAEGSISEKVVETGPVVHTARPGVYRLQYDCKNNGGTSATAVTRTVIVSENFKPGCTKLLLSGRIPGQPHSDKMGVYRMMFTRCERNNGKEGGVNQRPDGRCVATAPSGSAIYRQDGGSHVLSYFDKFSAWVVDPKDKYRSLKKTDHAGLRLPAPGVNHSPEDSASVWQRARKDGEWVQVKQMRVSCEKLVKLPTAFDYKVSVPIKVSGITVAQFSGTVKRGFIEALADTLDIRNADIDVISVKVFQPHKFPRGALDYGEANQLKHEGEAFGDGAGGEEETTWRRRLSGIDADSEPAAPPPPPTPQNKPIEIVVEITNTKKRIDESIVPQLTETMLGTVLKSEMIGQGLKVTAVDVESDLLSQPHLTTHAKIRLLAYVAGFFGLLVIAFTGRSIYQSLKLGKAVEEQGDNAALLKASSEEKRSLIATDTANAANAADASLTAKGVAVEDAEPERTTMELVQIYLGWLMLAASTVGPGSVIVCSDVGANHGLNLIWCLGVASFVAYTLQEAAARLCIVSGMSFGRAMRFKFGATAGSLPTQLSIATFGIGIGNSAYMCNNFASAMSSIGLLHERTLGFTVLMASLLAGMLLLTLTQGNVDDISKGLGLVVVLMTAVFASAAAQIGVEPETILYGMIPTVPKGAGVLALSVIGTTAIPFNLFLASAIAKGNTVKSMRTGMKLATCVAAVASTFIMIVGTGVKETSGAFTVHELGLTLRETVGEFATKCFAFGLLAAAFSASLGCTLGASVSIAGLNSTAGDDIGPGEEVLESVLDEDELWGKKSTNAMRLLCWCTFVGWLTAALQLPTVPVVLTAQVINGCLLPYLSYSLLICINDPTIMANQPQTAGQNVHGLLATFGTFHASITTGRCRTPGRCRPPSPLPFLSDPTSPHRRAPCSYHDASLRCDHHQVLRMGDPKRRPPYRVHRRVCHGGDWHGHGDQGCSEGSLAQEWNAARQGGGGRSRPPRVPLKQ